MAADGLRPKPCVAFPSQSALAVPVAPTRPREHTIDRSRGRGDGPALPDAPFVRAAWRQAFRADEGPRASALGPLRQRGRRSSRSIRCPPPRDAGRGPRDLCCREGPRCHRWCRHHRRADRRHAGVLGADWDTQERVVAEHERWTNAPPPTPNVGVAGRCLRPPWGCCSWPNSAPPSKRLLPRLALRVVACGAHRLWPDVAQDLEVWPRTGPSFVRAAKWRPRRRRQPVNPIHRRRR